jgi:hypothetical protein
VYQAVYDKLMDEHSKDQAKTLMAALCDDVCNGDKTFDDVKELANESTANRSLASVLVPVGEELAKQEEEEGGGGGGRH